MDSVPDQGLFIDPLYEGYRMHNLIRLWISIRLLLMNGWQRAAYVKSKRILHSQGRDCFFSITNFGTEPWLVSVADNVYLAAGVRFVNHDVSAFMVSKAAGSDHMYERLGPIHIGSNVFIGLNCILLPGTVIEDNVVIGAGTIVSGRVTGDGVYVGNPLRKLGDFASYCDKIAAENASYPWRQVSNLSAASRKDMKKRHFMG